MFLQTIRERIEFCSEDNDKHLCCKSTAPSNVLPISRRAPAFSSGRASGCALRHDGVETLIPCASSALHFEPLAEMAAESKARVAPEDKEGIDPTARRRRPPLHPDSVGVDVGGHAGQQANQTDAITAKAGHAGEPHPYHASTLAPGTISAELNHFRDAKPTHPGAHGVVELGGRNARLQNLSCDWEQKRLSRGLGRVRLRLHSTRNGAR